MGRGWVSDGEVGVCEVFEIDAAFPLKFGAFPSDALSKESSDERLGSPAAALMGWGCSFRNKVLSEKDML